MRWLFFVQCDSAQLLCAIGEMLESFRIDMGDRAIWCSMSSGDVRASIIGRWLIEGVYELSIMDALLASEFDCWLGNNPEYDTYRESSEVAALG